MRRCRCRCLSSADDDGDGYDASLWLRCGCRRCRCRCCRLVALLTHSLPRLVVDNKNGINKLSDCLARFSRSHALSLPLPHSLSVGVALQFFCAMLFSLLLRSLLLLLLQSRVGKLIKKNVYPKPAWMWVYGGLETRTDLPEYIFAIYSRLMHWPGGNPTPNPTYSPTND